MIQNKSVIKHLIAGLSERELSVLVLLSNDFRPQDISNELGLGKGVVEKCILDMRNKFESKSVAGMLCLLFRNKVIK